MSKTERSGMFHTEKMLKDKEFGSGRDIMEPIRDGESSMLTNPRRKEPQEWTESMDSTS
jgi:hypothetical protein